MKKLLTAFIAVLYLGLSSGFAINVHYCMGKIVLADKGADKSGKCGKCGMATKAGCCQDELTIVKINDSHQANYISYTFQQCYYLLPAGYKDLQVKFTNNLITEPALELSPPLITYPSLYLLYSVFRI